MFILLVDNNRFHASVLKQMLLKAGFDSIGYAENGIEGAIQVYKDEYPDVIIIDESQCHLNGVNIIKNIQVIRPEIKIIILSENEPALNSNFMREDRTVSYLLKECLTSDNLPKMLYTIFTEKLKAKKLTARHLNPSSRISLSNVANSL